VSDGDTDSEGYLVDIKRSARRRSAAAGTHVSHAGCYRRFESKALARKWARENTAPEAAVWIQDAAPHDSTPADGYLVGGRRHTAVRVSDRQTALDGTLRTPPDEAL
jgi:hypothetical protein